MHILNLNTKEINKDTYNIELNEASTEQWVIWSYNFSKIT